MDALRRRRFAQAALAYGVLNALATVVLWALFAQPEDVPAEGDGPSKSAAWAALIVIALFAFWIRLGGRVASDRPLLLAAWLARGARWLARILTVTCALRAVQHVLCFVSPTPIFWSTPWFANFPLADGSQHWGWFLSAILLGTAAVFLARAGWLPAAEPAPAAEPGKPGPDAAAAPKA